MTTIILFSFPFVCKFSAVFSRSLSAGGPTANRLIRNMSSNKLNSVKDADIDPEGVFKYILIKVHEDVTPPIDKNIVRGYKRCEYHADIFEEVEKKELKPLKLDGECLGGGRIQHDPAAKKIKVYGYSQGYGKADHEVSVNLLKKTFLGYDISWSDEGY